MPAAMDRDGSTVERMKRTSHKLTLAAAKRRLGAAAAVEALSLRAEGEGARSAAAAAADKGPASAPSSPLSAGVAASGSPAPAPSLMAPGARGERASERERACVLRRASARVCVCLRACVKGKEKENVDAPCLDGANVSFLSLVFFLLRFLLLRFSRYLSRWA